MNLLLPIPDFIIGLPIIGVIYQPTAPTHGRPIFPVPSQPIDQRTTLVLSDVQIIERPLGAKVVRRIHVRAPAKFARQAG